MSSRYVVFGLLVALVLTMPVGCSSKVSKENFDKVTTGMTQEQVEGILGEGTEEAGGGGTLGNLTGSAKVITWKDGEKAITITFVNGKMTAKVPKGL